MKLIERVLVFITVVAIVTHLIKPFVLSELVILLTMLLAVFYMFLDRRSIANYRLDPRSNVTRTKTLRNRRSLLLESRDWLSRQFLSVCFLS